MKLKYIVPDMAQTFGNLEFAGENDVEQQRVNGRFVPVTFREPTILSWCFPQRLGRSVSSMSRKSSSSILRLPPRERTCEVVATPTIS